MYVWWFGTFCGIIEIDNTTSGRRVRLMIIKNKYPEWVDNRLRKRKYNDLSNQRFGRLLVMYRSTDELMTGGNTTPRYACVCDCGSDVLTRGTSLKRGHTSSCKVCNRKNSLLGKNLEDLSGHKFNRWTVLERAESIVESSGKFATVWKCSCECGVVRNIRAGSLKGNTTHSCGCYKHEQLSIKRDLIGNSFGLWLVLYKDNELWISPTTGRWYYTWSCECRCGTIRSVAEQSLISNKTTSCGCTVAPSLEVFTREYLQESDIVFNRQITFEGLRGVGNGLLSYDFALYDDNLNKICLIECQGKQHFTPFDFFGGASQFKIQVEHDLRKRNHAKDLNIPLLEIDYRMITYDMVSNKINNFLNTMI